MATIRKGKPETRSTATPPPPTGTTTGAGEPSSEKVAARAYELWQASGRPDGRDQEHWFQAERELRSSRGGRPN